MRRLWCLAACVASFVAAPASASPAADELEAAVEQVAGATGAVYGARDTSGAGLDGLKVIEGPGGYLGVHHSVVGGRFHVRVATSRDLLEWGNASTLDTDAAQPTIAALGDGGYVVAYEKARAPVLPTTAEVDRLLAVLPPVQQLGRAIVQLRFRFYPSLDRLLAGSHSEEFTAPLTLSPTAEGTPSISLAETAGGAGGSRLAVGLHYFADLDGDSYPDVDRQATGVLTGFSNWSAAKATELDAAFLGLTSFHDGFSSPPDGHIGDRDHVTLDGTRLDVHEAQYVRNDFSSWRPFLIEPSVALAPKPLEVQTALGSKSFGNPTVTALKSPSGAEALFMTLFVFSEGAAPGEAGALIYYRER